MIESFNNKLFNKYSQFPVEKLIEGLEKVFAQDIDINIVFVKPREIKRLNKDYRGVNSVTDVLSFPLDTKGEVYICPRYVKREFKKDKFSEEILRLSIHGILHLLGYEHKGKFEEGNHEEMFDIQEEKVKEVLNLLNGKMYLIVGLGNPGEEYDGNRHNVGYLSLERLEEILKKEDFKTNGWKNEKIFDSITNIFEKNVGGNIKVVLLKPTTFMNNSGMAVKKGLKKYKVLDFSKELIIIHDDLDIPLGQYKIQLEKSPKGHNGVKSIEDHLGTTNFLRVRIGIENRNEKKIPGEKYVLMNFTEDEKVTLYQAIDSALDQLLLNLN